MKTLEVRTFLVLFLLSLALLFFDSRGVLNPVKSAVSVVVMPVQYGLHSVKLGFAETFSFLTFWKSGEERIKNLEQRNLELTVGLAKVSRLEEENGQLRSQLGVGEGALRQKTLLPAPILSLGRFMEVGVEDNSKIKIDQSVVFLENYLGRVVRIFGQAAFVRRVTDPEEKIPVKVGKASGLVSGQYNSSIQVDHIARNEEIKEGDFVLTSGEGGITPPNLIVGRLGKILSSQADLFQKAEVLPLVREQDLSLVFIIID